MKLIEVSYEPAGGPNGVAGGGEDCFARFHFTPVAQGSAGARDFMVPLAQIDGQRTVEVWRYAGPSEVLEEDGLEITRCADYLLIVGQVAEVADIRRDSERLYARMLPALARYGYDRVVKIWNYLPGINNGAGDQERYKQFCLGRAEALVSAGHRLDAPPAGTAVGCAPQAPMCVVLLATRHDMKTLENPRQVSAYRYPRQYGPRAPSFSRAALLGNGGAGQVFLSGTAAIVGHESLHGDDVRAQARETLRNLCTLKSRALALGSAAGFHSESARDAGLYRLYLRNPADLELALGEIDSLVSDPARLIVLNADICRRELLLEIDGLLGATRIEVSRNGSRT